jgi:hypothetical protein
MEGKIPRCKSSSKDTLTQSNDEVHYPQPTKEMKDLHPKKMAVEDKTKIFWPIIVMLTILSQAIFSMTPGYSHNPVILYTYTFSLYPTRIQLAEVFGYLISKFWN